MSQQTIQLAILSLSCTWTHHDSANNIDAISKFEDGIGPHSQDNSPVPAAEFNKRRNTISSVTFKLLLYLYTYNESLHWRILECSVDWVGKSLMSAIAHLPLLPGMDGHGTIPSNEQLRSRSMKKRWQKRDISLTMCLVFPWIIHPNVMHIIASQFSIQW